MRARAGPYLLLIPAGAIFGILFVLPLIYFFVISFWRVLLFKLKPFDVRVREIMREKKIEKKEAEKVLRRLRGLLPATVSSDYVYIKLFKNMPRSDVESMLRT